MSKKWVSPIYIPNRSFKKLPLILAVLGVVGALWLGLTIGSWSTGKAEKTSDESWGAAVAQDKVGVSLGRTMWKGVPLPDRDNPANGSKDLFQETIRVAQANQSGNVSRERTLVNMQKLAAAKPDFIGLQELTGKPDQLFAAAGYELYRPSPATGLLWNSSRWLTVNSGTTSLLPSRPASGEATWATFESKTTKRKVSVVSTFLAENTAATAGDPKIFANNLKSLIAGLKGEVVVLSTLHIGYDSTVWNALGIGENVNLRASYDSLGSLGATEKDANFSTDYILGKSSAGLKVLRQGKWEQNGEHSALWSDWLLRSKLPMKVKDPNALVLAPEPGDFSH